MIVQLAVLLAVVLVGSLMWLKRLREIHHGYYGLAFALIPWRPVQILGLILLTDDTLQHLVQCWRPAYLSPLHRLYGIAYRWAWVRRLNAWFDSVLA